MNIVDEELREDEGNNEFHVMYEDSNQASSEAREIKIHPIFAIN